MSIAVHIRPEAEADVEEAYVWYLERGADLSIGFLTELDHAVERIAAHP